MSVPERDVRAAAEGDAGELAQALAAEGRGWFSDVDAEADPRYQWQPCLETGQGLIPSFQVWFATKDECDAWIAENVIGVGWLD